ncbi:MAG: THUMP domain-containing protein [Thermoplasmata archaeon]
MKANNSLELKRMINKLRELNIEFIFYKEKNSALIFSDEDLEKILNLKRVYIFNLFEEIPEYFKNFKDIKFAVRSKFDSKNINPYVGELILKENKNLKVDLEDPDITIIIDRINRKNYFFIKYKENHGIE